MKLRLLVPGLLLLIVVISACAPPPTLRDETLLDDTSLVTGDPCGAPCWRGITPGETTWRNALVRIEDDATLENLRLQESDSTTARVAEWQQRGGSACCQMFTQDGETVSLIFLRTRPDLTLGEVIATHGEPAFLIGSPFSEDQSIVNLIFPDLATVVYVFVPGITGMIEETNEIIGVLYMTPADMELLLVTSSLHAWEGYETYAYYDQSTFAVTPSVTLTPTPAQ